MTAPIIVVEGLDNSGKSTLAEKIARALGGYFVQESEGPPTPDETIDERIRRYRRRDAEVINRVVYARHPVVSQPIYASIKGNRGDAVNPDLIQYFYDEQPLLIYCDPLDRGMSSHKLKEHDTPEFIADLESRQQELLTRYRVWAARHANIVYRIGDDVELVMRLMFTALQYRGLKGRLKKTPTY